MLSPPQLLFTAASGPGSAGICAVTSVKKRERDEVLFAILPEANEFKVLIKHAVQVNTSRTTVSLIGLVQGACKGWGRGAEGIAGEGGGGESGGAGHRPASEGSAGSTSILSIPRDSPTEDHLTAVVAQATCYSGCSAGAEAV